MNAYQLLRNTAPIFLQIAFEEPALWPNPHNYAAISLAHIFASTRYELGHFVLMDSLCSLTYGLPQVIEYDTSILPSDVDIHPVEWVHGCPTEFQIALVNINARFHQTRVGPEPDWRPIEHLIKSWQPAVQTSAEGESWQAVARLAVQESWRHTLLIYLYMVRYLASLSRLNSCLIALGFRQSVV
jgi:hypothetical protein